VHVLCSVRIRALPALYPAIEVARPCCLVAAEWIARGITERPELSAWGLTDIAETLFRLSA